MSGITNACATNTQFYLDISLNLLNSKYIHIVLRQIDDTFLEITYVKFPATTFYSKALYGDKECHLPTLNFSVMNVKAGITRGMQIVKV